MKKYVSPLSEERRKVFWMPAAAPLPEPQTRTENQQRFERKQHPIRAARSYRLPDSLMPKQPKVIAAE